MKIIPVGFMKQPTTKDEFIEWIKNFLETRKIKHPFQAKEKPFLICKVFIETDMDVPLLFQFIPQEDNQ